MKEAIKLGFMMAAQLAPSESSPQQTRAVVRARGHRLVSHAASAKSSMSEGYGTDVSNMSSADYKSRIRRLMMRG